MDYVKIQVLDWWRDYDSNEYYAITLTDGELKLVTRKVEQTNGNS